MRVTLLSYQWQIQKKKKKNPDSWLTFLKSPFFIPHQHAKHHAEWLSCSWETTGLRILKFGSFLDHAQLKFYKPPFVFLDLYMHVKNQVDSSVLTRIIVDSRTLHFWHTQLKFSNHILHSFNLFQHAKSHAEPFQRQPHKNDQTQSNNCLRVFDHFAG